MEIINRKAKHDYFIEETIECGIVLTGTEIKSVRKGSANLKDSYARIKREEIYLVNMFIAHYEEGSIFNHDETRSRKLLLHKKQIRKLTEKVMQEGYTLIPLKLYFTKGIAKIELVEISVGVCKGKKNYDKRETIKERDLKRSIEKQIKYR